MKSNELADGRACPSIVWLLVDSIRSYASEQDDIRGKLPFMERFGEDSVEFTTCVTTAPSTIMSVTAMMTGLPAYFLARNYDDFRFDGGQRHSLAGTLKEHGYSSWAFLRGMETREKFKSFLDPVPRDFWPKDLRHGAKWRNRDLDRVLDRVLEKGIPQPAFLFFHYNPRTRVETDHRLSQRVENTWERLVGEGFDADNTIYVLCSDHGYPASSTGISADWEIKTRVSHDLVLTDDNILIPLYIRYPGCHPMKIDTPVSTLDLFPTLLELAGIPLGEAHIDGVSLVPLIESGGREDAYPRRFFRCDSRLMLQTARSTAIRSREHKYVRFHDEHRLAIRNTPQPTAEMLLDLEEDPTEHRNLLLARDLPSEDAALLEEFRTEFDRTETKGLEFQIDYFLSRQRDSLHLEAVAGQSSQPRVLLAFEPNTAGYQRIGVEAIRRLQPDALVDLLADESTENACESWDAAHVYHYSIAPSGQVSAPSLESGDADGQRSEYDLSLLFVQNPSNPIVSDLLRIMKTVRAKKRLMMDCNFNAYGRHSYWYYRFRALLERLPYVFEEPRLLLDQIRIAGSVLRRQVLVKLGRWERWEAAKAASED